MNDDEVLQSLGRGVKKARKAKGWSQDTLGEKVELTFHSISNIERGVYATDAKKIGRLAAALEVPIHRLFDPDPKSREAKRQAALSELVDLLEGHSVEMIEEVTALVMAVISVKRRSGKAKAKRRG